MTLMKCLAKSLSTFAFLIGVSCFICAEDLREYQHGIDFVPKPDGTYYLI